MDNLYYKLGYEYMVLGNDIYTYVYNQDKSLWSYTLYEH